MKDEINIKEQLAKIRVRKALMKISALVMEATDEALEVNMPRERFVEAIEKFTEAYWVE